MQALPADVLRPGTAALRPLGRVFIYKALDMRLQVLAAVSLWADTAVNDRVRASGLRV